MAVSEAPCPWLAPDAVQMCSTAGSTSRLRQEHATTKNQIYARYSDEDGVVQI